MSPGKLKPFVIHIQLHFSHCLLELVHQLLVQMGLQTLLRPAMTIILMTTMDVQANVKKSKAGFVLLMDSLVFQIVAMVFC